MTSLQPTDQHDQGCGLFRFQASFYNTQENPRGNDTVKIILE